MNAAVYGLIYHDVTPVARRSESGFTGTGAEHYKLTPEEFDQHLKAIASAGRTPIRVTEPHSSVGPQICLTFDDGGRSAATTIGPLLETRGWPGHFFITTERIGQPGFVSEQDIRSLASAGHVIGSHSHTHRFMTRLSGEEITDEWVTSKKRLEAILGEPVTVLSIPTGYYSARVGRLAVQAEYRHLFTSEPWDRPRAIGEGTLYGRFSITASTPPARVAALARASRAALGREGLAWNTRKIAKAALGPLYSSLRHALLRRNRGAASE